MSKVARWTRALRRRMFGKKLDDNVAPFLGSDVYQSSSLTIP